MMIKVLIIKKIFIVIALVIITVAIIGTLILVTVTYDLKEVNLELEVTKGDLQEQYEVNRQYVNDNYELTREVKDLASDIGVWSDKSIELQEEINEWEACAERRKKKQGKVKILPVAPKVTSIINVIPKIKPGVVHIMCPRWQGSGFVVAENLIATARHCVEGVENFIITTDDGHKLKATKAISSERHDIAFIYIDDLSCTLSVNEHDAKHFGTFFGFNHTVKLHVLELGSITECQLGQELITIGSPYGKVNFNSVTLGIISGLDRDYDPLNDSYYGYNDYGWSVAFQTDSPGHPGNSGCAIFTADGKVRGILVGGFSPSLIIAMPVDLFIKDLEEVKRMFTQGRYYVEESMFDAYNSYGMLIGPGFGN